MTLTVYYQWYMGSETVHGQTPVFYNEGITAGQETASPFADESHMSLIGSFYATEGDPTIGRELSARLFAHAGLANDPATLPLIGPDGRQVQGGDGSPLTLVDYVNYAAVHHPHAIEGILDFLTMQPGQPDYMAVRGTMFDWLTAGRR